MSAGYKNPKHILIPGIGCQPFTDKVFSLIGEHYNEDSVGIRYTKSELFANGEWRIQIDTEHVIRNRHVYIFASGVKYKSHSINDIIVHTLGLIDACQRADVKSITLIWLLFPYARSDKKVVSREPIMASMLIKLLDSYDKIRRIVTMDIHSGQLQGFTSKVFTNLFANPCIKEYMTEVCKNAPNGAVLVSPDTGSVRRIKDYMKDSSKLQIFSVTVSKTRSYSENNVIESSSLSDADKELIRDKTAIIIDDIIDTAGTIVSTASVLESAGVNSICVFATHGILSHPAIERLNNCRIIERVFVTDTIDQTENLSLCPKLTVISVSDLISQYILCLLEDKSLSTLYE